MLALRGVGSSLIWSTKIGGHSWSTGPMASGFAVGGLSDSFARSLALATSATTPVISELEPNDSLDTAMAMDRGSFQVAENPALWDESLPSLTVSGAFSDLEDQDFFSVYLNVGETLYLNIATTTGNPVAVRVFDTRGVEHTGVIQQFEALESGTYYFAVQAQESTSPVGPIITSTEAAIPYTMHLSVQQPVDSDLEGLLSGSSWDNPDLTYSFPTSPGDYEYEVPSTFMGTSASHQATINSILQTIGFSGLTFTLASTPGGGDLRFAFADTGYAGYAYYPGPESGGDSWYSYLNFSNPTPIGSKGYFILLHEIGHSLGLKHGHEHPALSPEHNTHEFSIMTYRSWSGAPADPGLNGGEEHGGSPQSFMMLDIAALQHLYGADFSFNGGDTTYRWDPNTGEMSVDGEGQGPPQVNRIFRTIWDGGGNDTYDLSNYSNGVSIDLRPGEWTTASAAQLVNLHYTGDPTPPVYARGNIANALLYQGDTRSLIENAIGGAGNDILVGNQAANRLNGNAGDDSLYGDAGNDILDGGTGADRTYGGAGNDTYRVDNSGDRIIEYAGEGIDTVFSSVSFTLGANVENLNLTGSAVRGTGNGLGNRIVGNSGDNILDGRGGADEMRGRLGNDTYYVGNSGDLAVENAGEGTDLVYSSVSYRLRPNVENLTLTGSAIRAYGNSDANRIVGNAANNILDGLGGADVMRGGLGDDIYYVENTGDRVIENFGEGTDTVFSSVSFALTSDVENLNLTGSAVRANGNTTDNRLVGNGADNILNGGQGADVMRGGAGDDRYYVDNIGDRVIENSGEGRDRVYSQVDFTLGSDVDDLFLRGSNAIDGTGNAQDNTILGNIADNILTGGGGADDLRGGGGADMFVFDDNHFGGIGASICDRIIDFSRAQGDIIDLGLVDANGTLGGDQEFAFIGTGDFTDTAGELRYKQAGGNTYVYGDTDGDGTADFMIRIDGLHSFIEGDFVL